MKLTLVLVGLAAVVGIVFADFLMVSEIQNAIKVTCETRVLFDKSGEMYCADTVGTSIRLGQK